MPPPTLAPFDDQSLAFEFTFTDQTPIELIEVGKAQARHKLAIMLVDRLASQQYLGRFFVIDFLEDMKPGEYGSGRYQVGCHVSEAETRHFVMPELPNYNNIPLWPLTLSAIDELGYRFRRAVRKVAKTIFKKQGDM